MQWVGLSLMLTREELPELFQEGKVSAQVSAALTSITTTSNQRSALHTDRGEWKRLMKALRRENYNN